MSADNSLVVSLVQRLATRLPHRTGSSSTDLDHDDFAALSRDTLIEISSTNIPRVIESLLQLLEELSRPYNNIHGHPPHILNSELYLLHLLADCCTAHWNSVNTQNKKETSGGSPGHSRGKSLFGEKNGRPVHRLLSGSNTRANLPAALHDELVQRVLAALRTYLSPLPDDFIIPASSILHEGSSFSTSEHLAEIMSLDSNLSGAKETAELLSTKADEIEAYTRSIVEFISASNWSYTLEFIRNELRGPHMNPPIQGGSQNFISTDEDKPYLVSFRLIAMLWVDARKLGTVIQEVCGSFLHFRKPFQHTIAIVLPLLITRWIEQNPMDFVELHISHKRLDGGADTLFDMTNTNTMTDHVRLKTVLYPFQTTLLFLLPDVWDVASGMRDAKSSSMGKKVAYLESLRKAVRNKNEAAAYCLVSLLRVARHFSLDSDSTLLSYALDVQDEVREALFRKYAAGPDSIIFNHGLLTAAFVSIVHLDFENSMESFAPLCLAVASPQDFKIAYVSSCCHFARQSDASSYQPFYSQLSGFIRSHLKTLASSRQSSDNVNGLLKPVDASSSNELLHHILTFLNLQPMNLYDGAPVEWPDRGRFYDENFAAFVACLAMDDETIRGLASMVAKKVLNGITSFTLNRSTGLISKNFYTRFWRSS